MIDLLLRNVRIEGTEELVDVAVDAGRILARGHGLSYPARQEIDAGGRLLVPGFVEGHVHLDIALVNDWARPGRVETYRSQAGMIEAVERLRAGFTRADIERRAGQALQMASRHGVTALRAQCHIDTQIGLKHFEALMAVREAFAGRVTLQIVAYPQHGYLRDPNVKELMREAIRLGADVLSCSPGREIDGKGTPVDWRAHIDAAFELAAELDVDVDMHADLSLPPAHETVPFEELEIVHAARKMLEIGYHGRLVAAHLCRLGTTTPDVARQVIDLLQEAEVSVISLPDLYRLGRTDSHSVRRGLTRVKELLAAGINVAYASNNVRDALRPLGNLDPLEEGLILAYGAHMDTVDELATIMQMSSYNGARALKLPDYGLEPGCRADMVVLDAPSAPAAIVNQAEKRFVFKAGWLIAANECRSTLLNGPAVLPTTFSS